MKKNHVRLLIIDVCLLGLLLIAWPALARTAAPERAQLSDVWRRVRNSGVYNFRAQVIQESIPRATIQNVGRTSKRDELYMEGQTRLADQSLNFTLWQQGGNVLDPSTGYEFKTENGRAYVRAANQPWQEINDFSGLFAPEADFTAYLAVAQDVTQEVNQDGTQVFHFRVDGYRYAIYMRDQLEKQLSNKGQLPAGVDLDVPKVYAGMTGQGELWVGQNGLPTRQDIDLEFPQVSEENQVKAQVKVTFNFPKGAASNPVLGGLLALPNPSPDQLQTMGETLIILALVAGLVYLLIARRRSRKLYTAIAISMSLLMVVTPLLQSQQVSAFSSRQAAQAAEQEARTQESDLNKELARYQQASDWNPNISLLERAQLEQTLNAPAHTGLLATAGMVSVPPLPRYAECDNPTADSDGDGLTNGEECTLGTSPIDADTDSDSVSDYDEVNGFVYAGKTWYTNPLEADTNRDGLSDGQEWNVGNNGTPPDTDGDGTPDLFDRDNDNDGVPDNLDLSPYFKSPVFGSENPFGLVLSGLTAGKPTFAEFQLRPANSQHLWYALNVMDWSMGDEQGQMQDADGKTFYDVDNSQSLSPNDNGDVRLLPMLEIKITGSPTNLPAQSELDKYGISVNDLAGGNKVVYMPLQVITDEKGGERVALGGRMPYLPGATWGNAQQVRVAWLVQALVDVCAEYQDGQCLSYSEYNQSQIIQTYYDDWFLTGLSAREERGTAMSVIYEDPGPASAPVDQNLNSDDSLMELMYGLDNTFLAARNCDTTDTAGNCTGHDAIRDLGVISTFEGQTVANSTIQGRFNHTTNGSVTAEQRWNISNTLSVTTTFYATLDDALVTTAVTTTKAILTGSFQPRWSTAAPISPTLMFVREERYRAFNMDESRVSSTYFLWSGAQLTIYFAPSGAAALPLQVMGGLSWAPFRYSQATGWSNYVMQDYWSELGRRAALQLSDETDAETRAGKQAMVQMLYLSLYKGTASLLESAGTVYSRAYQTSDKPLGFSILGVVGLGIKLLFNQYFMYALDKWAGTICKTLGKLLLEGLNTLTSWITVARMAGTYLKVLWQVSGAVERLKLVGKMAGVGALVIGVVAGVIVLAVFMAKGYLGGNQGWMIGVAVIAGIVAFAITVIYPIYQIYQLASTVVSAAATLAQKALAFAQVLTARAECLGNSIKAGVVGLVIAIAIAVGIFIYAMATQGASMSTIAIQMLLAQTIAAIVVAVIMFVANISIVGTIITAILGVIDLILTLAGCKFTISGWVTEQIAKYLYHYELTVDAEQETGNFGLTLTNPDRGMAAGNGVRVGLTMTTSVVHTDPNDPRVLPYFPSYWTPDYLRSASFVYELSTQTAAETGIATSKDARRSDWVVTADHTHLLQQLYRGTYTDTLAGSTALPAAGLNRTLSPLNLNTGFSMPGVSCWTIITILGYPIAACYKESVGGSNGTEIGASIIVDVFPATVDAFMDVTSWCDGCVIHDADGDGLVSMAYGGNDPDDTKWDTDGDGLSDWYELDMRSRSAAEGGLALDPLNSDTDGDLLNDGEEVRLGTNPANWDTDGDSISDKQELEGYTFIYAPGKSITMFTDPLNADADGDGMDDLYERSLHTACDQKPTDAEKLQCRLDNRYSPNAWNPNPIGLYTGMSPADGIVAPSQYFPYTVTVQNNLNQDLASSGRASLTLPPKVTGGPLSMDVDLLKGMSQSYAPQLHAEATVNTATMLTDTLNVSLHTPSTWAWDSATSLTKTTTTGSVGQSVVVVPVSGWTQPYLAVSAESATSGPYRMVAYPVSSDGTFGTGTYLDAGGSTLFSVNGYSGYPAIACANNGVCLMAVSGQNNTVNQWAVFYRRITPDWNLPVPTSIQLSANKTSGVHVATDGTDFIVIWRDGANAVKVQRVTNAGATSGSVQQLDSGASGEVDITYADTHYVAVWTKGGQVWTADVYPSSGAGALTLVPNAISTSPTTPTIKYDPYSRQSLIVYQSTLTGTVGLRARTVSDVDTSPEFTLENAPASSVAVSTDPGNSGWVVAWGKLDGATKYQAVGPNGTLRGATSSITGPSATQAAQVGLICALPRQLRHFSFDELSNSSTFADSSGSGGSATCADTNTCPLSGVGGKYGNAISFDGANDVVTAMVDVPEDGYAASLWFNTTCRDCGMFQVASNNLGSNGYDRTLYLSNGNVCARVWSNETICSSGDSLADGNWHQIVHTFGTTLGGQKLYVDGVLRATGTKTASGFNWSDRVEIGYTADAAQDYWNGYIDDVTLYGRALSAGEVGDNYTAALAVFSLDEPAGSTTFVNAAHNTYTASCGTTSSDNIGCPALGGAGKAYSAPTFGLNGSSNRIKVANAPRTLSVYSYTFESGVPSGWTNGRTELFYRGAPATTYALGRYGNDTVNLNLSNLPTHDQVTIDFDLYVMGSWYGNRHDLGPSYWKLSADGATVLNTTFSTQGDTCGNYQSYPDAYTSADPSGIKLYTGVDMYGNCTGTGYLFTGNASNLGNYSIGNDKAKCFQYTNSDLTTVATAYQDSNYAGDTQLFDTYRWFFGGGCWNSKAAFGVSSLKVWRSYNTTPRKPKTGALEISSVRPVALGGSGDVYHISQTLDGHSASSLALSFTGQGLNASAIWALDNVQIKVNSRNVPLTGSSFTVAAWAKRSRSSYQDWLVTQGSENANLGLALGWRADNRFTCSFSGGNTGNELLAPAAYTDDGNWHHWACTYDATSNTRRLYRDGAQIASDTAPADYVGYGTLTIGNGFMGWITVYNYYDAYKGMIDEVGVWNDVLSADQIKRLYDKVKVLDDSVSECVMPRAYSGNNTLQSSPLLLRETTTFLGNSTQQNVTPLKIDADTPTSALTSLTSGQWLGATGTLVIGGVANDFGEIAKVEVSVDNGTWQTATGGRVWAFAWNTSALAEGSHTLRTRATDTLGRVETPGSGLSVTVKHAAPALVTTMSNPSTLAAHLDAQGRWVIPLAGRVGYTASQYNPIGHIQSVEAMLVGEGNVAGQGWQKATLGTASTVAMGSGQGLTWTLDYILPMFNNSVQAMPNPTGRYTFLTRATDIAGNQTPSGSYPSLTILTDNAAPVGKLVYSGPSTTTISGTLTLTGTVLDPSVAAKGISSLQINYVPAEQVDVTVSRTLALLHLEEPTGAMRFDDGSGQGNVAACGSLSPKLHISFDEQFGPTFADVAGLGLNATCPPIVPAAQWKMDDAAGSTTLADSSGNGRTASCVGATCPLYRVGGVSGAATYYDAVSLSKVNNSEVGLSFGGVKPFSLAAWVKPRKQYGGWTGYYILSKDRVGTTGEYSLWMNANGTIRFHRSATAADLTSDTAIPLESWSHVTATYDGVTMRVYINGHLAGSLASGEQTTDTSTPLLIGASYAGAYGDISYRYQGSLDEVAIYSQALSQEQVTALSQLNPVLDPVCPMGGATGQFGTAAEFDGVDDYVTAPDNPALRLSTFSVGAWVKPTQITGKYEPIIVKENASGAARNYGLFVNPSGGIHFSFMDGACSAWRSYNSNGVLRLNDWNHVLMTYDGSTFNLYLDGTLDKSVAIASTVCQNKEPIRIGQEPGMPTWSPFAGVMDQAVIYGRGLSADEAMSLYLYGRVPACPTAAVSGQVDRGVQFDGAEDYLVVGPSASLALNEGKFTQAAWIYPTTADAFPHGILGSLPAANKYSYPSLWTYQGTRLQGGFGDGTGWSGLVTGNVLAPNAWNHVAATFDGTTYKLFINGNLAIASPNWTGHKPYTGTTQLTIGKVDTFFGGKIDEVLLMGRALSDNDVRLLYQSGSPTWSNTTLAASGNGITTTTWSSVVPGNLDGFYQINLRGTDVLDNLDTDRGTWRVWRGMIDTRAPSAALTVTLAGSGSTAQTIYSFAAEDVNLYLRTSPTDTRPAAWDFTSPCSSTTYVKTMYHTVSPWYQSVASDTNRLYRITGTCSVAGAITTTVSLKACDIFGHCTTTSKAPAAVSAAARLTPLAPEAGSDVAILSPASGSVLTAGGATTVGGGASSSDFIRTLTLRVDGVVTGTLNWASGTMTDTGWSLPWTPSNEGQHTLQATLLDWAGNVVTSTPVIVTLDTTPPEVDVTRLITTAHMTNPGWVALNGTATDAAGIASVNVQASGEWLAASASSGTWRTLWPVGSDVDGVTFPVAVQATDLGGHTTSRTENVVVDIVPPAPVTLTLAYTSSLGILTPLLPDASIHDVASPTLVLNWTTSSDGAGLSQYLVRWTARTASGANVSQVSYSPGDPRRALYAAGEAQAVEIEFATLDMNGNVTWQMFGTVYADSRLTPDYCSLSMSPIYEGWMDSGCSLIGVDRRVNQHASNKAALNAEQKFYATWDMGGLRLAWTGANWNTDGDLFVYLDTASGGTGQLYNPYAELGSFDTINIFLPGNDVSSTALAANKSAMSAAQPRTLVTPLTARQANAAARASTGAPPLITNARSAAQAAQQSGAMLADYLVWVKSSTDARLLHWDGNQWVQQAQLAGSSARMDTNAQPAITDIYLPFSMLSIADPAAASLDLLAVASQDDALKLWAVMPERNPVTAEEVVNPISSAVHDQNFALSRQYHWDGLGAAICPNGAYASGPSLAPVKVNAAGPSGGAFADTDLHMSITLDPAGTSYAFMDDNLAWLWNVLFGGGSSGAVYSLDFSFMDTNHRPLGDGQTITYTIHYQNKGTQTATGVKVDLNSYYSLDLPDAEDYGYWENKTIDLGDVPPGAEFTRTFTAQVSVSGVGMTRYNACRASGLSDTVCQPMLRWASLDAFVYDDRSPLVKDAWGNPTEPPLEWMWVDHHVDSRAPEFLGIQSPVAVAQPGVNTVTGYVYDESAVPSVMVEWRPAGGSATSVACTDPSPLDGVWSCNIDLGARADGDVIELRVQATDVFGHVSDWTAWQSLVVDTTPPVVTVNPDTLAMLQSSVLGTGNHVLDGTLSDNHGAQGVQVCQQEGASETCGWAQTQLTGVLTQTASTYDDAPSGGLAIDSTTTCDGNELVRTFEVADTFKVGQVNLGFNAEHAHRDDIEVELESPSGTRARAIYGLGSLYDPFRNYDVLLKDTSAAPLHNSADDNVLEPYYDREARPYQPLAVFSGESAQGIWKLYVCDVAPAQNDGIYNRSQLVLYSQAAAQATSGAWSYLLPSLQNADGQQLSLSIYGVDAAGNHTSPVTVSYQVDVVPPALTVDDVPVQVSLLAASPATLSGRVSDGSGQVEVYLMVIGANGVPHVGQAAVTGNAWTYTPPLGQAGVYTVWVEARDVAGNSTVLGPYQITAISPFYQYMPLMMQDYIAPEPHDPGD